MRVVISYGLQAGYFYVLLLKVKVVVEPVTNTWCYYDQS